MSGLVTGVVSHTLPLAYTMHNKILTKPDYCGHNFVKKSKS